MADSAQLLAAASMDIVMDASIEKGHRLIRLLSRGRGLFANQNWVIKSCGMTDFALVAKGEGVSLEGIHREQAIVDWLSAAEAGVVNEGFDASEIADAMGLNHKTCLNLLGKMAKAGMVQVSGKSGNRKLYCLPVP